MRYVCYMATFWMTLTPDWFLHIMDFFLIQIVAHTTKSTGSKLISIIHVLSLSQLATCALLFLGYVSSFAICSLTRRQGNQSLPLFTCFQTCAFKNCCALSCFTCCRSLRLYSTYSWLVYCALECAIIAVSHVFLTSTALRWWFYLFQDTPSFTPIISLDSTHAHASRLLS